MKDIEIINESSAITMYYGYTKYSDLFGNGNKIDPTIEKNILFIDIGYSKTSIILSDFKSKGFSVKKVKYLPYFGGRYFDEIIANLCIDEFIKTNNIESIEISDRMKYRLLEVIKQKLPNLSINDEIKILVDSFYEEQDLDIYIKQEKYENEIISNDNYYKQFISILEELKNEIDNEKIKIDYVEIAGEFMRTPFLQKKINEIFANKDNKKKIISTTILIDECASVGAALLGKYLYGDFPLTLEPLEFNYLGYSNKQIFKGKEEIRKYIESLKGNKSELEKNQFISKIQNHISEQKGIDEKYDDLIKKKSEKSKSIYYLKNLALKNDGLKVLLKQLNDLERRLRNMELSDIKLQNLNNDLDNIYKDAYSIEKERIEKKLNEDLSSIKDKGLSNEKEIEKSILQYKEKIQKLSQKEENNISKFQKLNDIQNEINNSNIKEYYN
jgi:molecular chaperone DnaK (HSP70)